MPPTPLQMIQQKAEPKINWVRTMQVIRTVGALVTSAANIFFIWRILHTR